jgi:hypothetical protein
VAAAVHRAAAAVVCDDCGALRRHQLPLGLRCGVVYSAQFNQWLFVFSFSSFSLFFFFFPITSYDTEFIVFVISHLCLQFVFFSSQFRLSSEILQDEKFSQEALPGILGVIHDILVDCLTKFSANGKSPAWSFVVL